MNPLAIFKPKYEKQQELKARVLKNREAILDAFSSNVDRAKCCPYLMRQKCINKMCEFFMELKSINKENKEVVFWRCAIVETPLLIIELNQNIRNLTQYLAKGEK